MTDDVKELAAVEKAFLDGHKEIKSLIAKADGEIKETGKLATETKNALNKVLEMQEDIGKRIDKIEAKGNRKGDGSFDAIETVGTQFIGSDSCKSLMQSGRGSARLAVKQIVNATGQNQPLVPAQRVGGIIAEPNRRLTIRDLLMAGRTSSNLIEYTKENVFTNSAAPQYEASPERFESVRKAESTITFTQATAAVVTLAHFIKASKQVLADAPALQSYIDGRLTYGLKLEEEDEILNGVGTSGQLNGLINQATAFNRGSTNQTRIDTLRKALTQVQVSEYSASGFVLNPQDWEVIELAKDADNRYLIGDPNALRGPSIWGRPVVITNSIPADSWLCGAFDMCAQLWDREDAAVQVGFENDDFTKNMVTILAEERLALTVYRTLGMVKGTFSAQVG